MPQRVQSANPRTKMPDWDINTHRAQEGAGKNQEAMAELVNVSPSTICRELQRNKGKKGYRPEQAQIKAEYRRKLTAKPLKMTAGAIDLIDAKIIIDWSPEQISGGG